MSEQRNYPSGSDTINLVKCNQSFTLETKMTPKTVLRHTINIESNKKYILVGKSFPFL